MPPWSAASASTTSPIDGTVIGTAETDDRGLGVRRLQRTTGTEVEKFFNAYVAENRQYDGYDTSLRTAYNFGLLQTQPDWVENYPYQNGMLINYWNTTYADNNVGDHPGAGLILPVDAHPKLTHWSDGTLMRPRILSYDSTFGSSRPTRSRCRRATSTDGSGADPHRHHRRRRPAVPMFDDHQTWWFGSRRARRRRDPPGPLPARLVQREPAQDRHHASGSRTTRATAPSRCASNW